MPEDPYLIQRVGREPAQIAVNVESQRRGARLLR